MPKLLNRESDDCFGWEPEAGTDLDLIGFSRLSAESSTNWLECVINDSRIPMPNLEARTDSVLARFETRTMSPLVAFSGSTTSGSPTSRRRRRRRPNECTVWIMLSSERPVTIWHWTGRQRSKHVSTSASNSRVELPVNENASSWDSSDFRFESMVRTSRIILASTGHPLLSMRVILFCPVPSLATKLRINIP